MSDNPTTTLPLGAASPSLSAPSPAHTTQQVEIPATTVIGIGLGFVALTSGILFSIIGIRMARVYVLVRQRRAAGEANASFREEWRRAGGMFGFVSGFGSGAGDSALIVGAGGVETRRRIEIMMLREQIRNAGKPDLVEPLLWDCRIGQMGGARAVEEVTKWDILAMASSPRPKSTDRHITAPPKGHRPPFITLSILIAMPIDPTHSSQLRSPYPGESLVGEENMWELPDIMFGLTSFEPVVPVMCPSQTSAMGIKDDRQQLSQPDPQARIKGLETKAEVQHIERVVSSAGLGSPDVHSLVVHGREGVGDGLDAMRPARWKKDRQGKWHIEGLGGV